MKSAELPPIPVAFCEVFKLLPTNSHLSSTAQASRVHSDFSFPPLPRLPPLMLVVSSVSS